MHYRVDRTDLQRDRDQILAFWRRHLPLIPHHEQHLDWGYTDNPFAPGRVWTLFGDDCPVGVIGVLVRRLKVGNAVVLAGRLGGLAVDAEHRSLGPALMLQRAVLNDRGRGGLSAIYSSVPNPLVPATSRAGYRSILTVSRFVRLLDTGPLLRRRLPSETAARWLTRPANGVLRALAGSDWRPVELCEVDEFDGRFDDLWSRAAQHWAVTTERTSAFLRWRFTENPVDYSFTTVCAQRPGDHRITGYAVCTEDAGQVSVLDLLAEDAAEALCVLLTSVVRWARGRGASAVVVKCAAAGPLGAALRACRFHERPDDHPITLMASSLLDEGQDRVFTSAANWHFLAADDYWH